MESGLSLCGVLKPEMIFRTGFLHAGHLVKGAADKGRFSVNVPPHTLHSPSQSSYSYSGIPYFFKNALNKSIGSGRNVVVLCSLAISRMVWR